MAKKRLQSLSNVDRKIKSLLNERDNNPLTNTQITKIKNKIDLLNHLKVNKKNIARFWFMPQVDAVEFTTKHGIEDWGDSLEIDDAVSDLKFTGKWTRDWR